MLGYRFINGIIEFDRKLLSPDPQSSPGVRLVSLSKTFWSVVLAVYAAYYVGFRVYFGSYYTTSFVERTHLIHELFSPPEPVVFTVMATTCFYLRSVGDRFRALDGMWRHQVSPPPSLTAASAERIRLLHAELSELLRSYSSGYGPVLLVYFAFTFGHAVFETFLLVIVIQDTPNRMTVVPFIFFSQHVINMLSVLCVTSWVIEKVCEHGWKRPDLRRLVSRSKFSSL